MIFVAGASGFVGSHLTDKLIAEGQKIKCLARSDKAAQALAAKGAEIIRGDITAPDSLRGCIQPEDIVIHLVGIIQEKGKATFQTVHVEGTAHLVNEAVRAGVKHFFYQSALGADVNSWSAYLKSKAEAEEIVRNSGLSFSIFRPSLIIGPWDGFTKKLLDMIKLSPVLPLPGDGAARFQPLYIKDWLKCIGEVIRNPANFRNTYEIGGPEHLTFRVIVETLGKASGSVKPVIRIPMSLMKLGVSLAGSLPVSLPVSAEQLRLLESDNICDLDSVEKHFGFQPLRYEQALQDFI